MRKLFVLALALVLSSLAHAQTPATLPATQPATQSAVDPEVDAWLMQIEAKTEEIRSLKAGLRLVTADDFMGSRQLRIGELWYVAGPPARFKAAFTKLIFDKRGEDIDTAYIFDGTWLTQRNGEDKVFQRWQLAEEGEEATLLDLGDGPFVLPLNQRKDAILERFDVSLLTATEDDPPNSVHLRLIRKHDPEAGWIDLWYDRDSLLPVRAGNDDGEGGSKVVDLLDVEVNEPIDDAAFEAEVPDGPGWTVSETRLDEDGAG